MSATHEFEEKDTRTILTEIVIRIMNEDQANPDEDRWHSQFTKEVTKAGLRSAADSDHFDLLAPFACGKSQPQPKKLPATDPDEQEARRLEAAAARLRGRKAAIKIIESIKSVVIMELMSPLNKPYGDCTLGPKGDMAKIGGWAASIAKRGTRNDTVRKKLTEADLHKARGF